jgi:hypothetical protein
MEYTPEMRKAKPSSVIIVILTVSVLLAGWPHPAQSVGINVWSDFTSSLQILEADGQNNEEGFTGVRGNVHIGSSIRKDLYSYTELHLRSGDDVDLHQSYFTLDEVAGDFSLKMGRFNLGYGLPFNYRTDNAEAGQNTLVGNPLVDPYAVQDGAQAIYRGNEYSLRGSLTSGTARPGVSTNRSFGKTVRLYRFRDELGWSFSYYASDQSSTKETTNFLVNPAPESYLGLNTPDTTTTKVTSPGKGNNLEALQFDLRYDPGSEWTANMFFGQVEDDSGADANTLRYYTIRYEQSLDDVTMVTGQFGEARYREVNGSSPGGESVRRLQVGLLRQLAETTTLKVEYVDQTVDSGLAGQLNTRRPLDFSGLITQLHVNF